MFPSSWRADTSGWWADTSRALEIVFDDASILSNRSIAHLRYEEYGSAMADASAAIDINPKLPKV